MKDRTNARRGVAALVIAVLAASLAAGVPLMSASAASTGTITVGDGAGSILYRAHRVADESWDPCFAPACDAGTGPGASMYFVVYDSSGELIANGFADESGTSIKGLSIGSTYHIYPADCDRCHNSTHNVEFDRWADGSSERPRGFAISSDAPVSADAYYEIVELGTATPQPDSGTITTDLYGQLTTEDIQELVKQIEATAKSKGLTAKVIQHNSRNVIIIVTGDDERFKAPIQLHFMAKENMKEKTMEKLLEKFEDKKNHPPFLNFETVDELLDDAKDHEKPSAGDKKNKK
jgi:hypothetical protein